MRKCPDCGFFGYRCRVCGRPDSYLGWLVLALFSIGWLEILLFVIDVWGFKP